MADQAPVRGPTHDALQVFVGKWKAEGTSYGGTDQSGSDPKANGEPWISTHEAHWHTGSFFLVQDERAKIAGRPFDTLSLIGVDPHTGDCIARTFENHGFYRHYRLSVQDGIWTLTGETERARFEFMDDARTQVITWEWRPGDQWLPLCDRIAVRIA